LQSINKTVPIVFLVFRTVFGWTGLGWILKQMRTEGPIAFSFQDCLDEEEEQDDMSEEALKQMKKRVK
jgi:hypothetical protein